MTQDQTYSRETAAIKSVAISNEMYGNSIMSAYELAKGFSKPMEGVVHKVPDEIAKAHEELQARRKLARILKSKSYPEPELAVGDMVEIYIHGKNNKRGEWSLPKTIIKIDKEGTNIFVPGKSGKTICAAYEDVRIAVGENEFSKIIAKALDDIDEQIDMDSDNQIIMGDQDEIEIENINDCQEGEGFKDSNEILLCLLYTSPSPRDQRGSRMPSSA